MFALHQVCKFCN